METVEHVFFSCPKAKQIWERLLEWWRKRTGESLDCSVRVTLLGLRYHPDDDQDRLQFAELATPFAFLRTHTYDILHRERLRVRKRIPARSVEDLVSAVLKDLQRSACSLLHAARSWDLWHPPSGMDIHPRSVTAFFAAWVRSGLARLTPSRDYPVVLRIRHE